MLSLHEHTLLPDGTVRIAVLVEGPLPDTPDTVLADVGGNVTDLGDTGALVTWHYGAAMAPPDVAALCLRHVRDALARWACRWIGGPIDLR